MFTCKYIPGYSMQTCVLTEVPGAGSMRKSAFSVFCILLLAANLCVAQDQPQGKYGFEAGALYPSFKTAYITPTVKGYFMAHLSHTLYLGGELSYQRFSFLDNVNPSSSTVAFGSIISIRQMSSYLFIAPKLQVGIGWRKHVFADFSMGPGIYLGGVQWSHDYEPYWTTPGGGAYGKDTISFNTTYNLPNVVFKMTCGLTERIPTYRYWNIVLSETYGYLPGKLGKESPAIRSNYFALTLGVMHKYPVRMAEED